MEKIKKHGGQPNWSTLAGSAFHNITEAIDLGEHDLTYTSGLPGSWDEYMSSREEYTKQAFDLVVEDERKRSPEWPEETYRATGKVVAKPYSLTGGPNKCDRDWFTYYLPIWLEKWNEWRRTIPYDLAYLPTEDAESVSLELAVETEFTANIGGVNCKGFIDRVYESRLDGSMVVVDFKAGSMEPSSSIQLGIYREALRQTRGVVADWGVYYLARKAIATEPKNLRMYTSEMLAYRHRMLADRVEAGDFVPNFDACKMCNLQEKCVWVGGIGEAPGWKH